MTKPKVYFVLTVDTEEEWDWSGPFPNKDFSVRNIKELPAFQNYCQGLGVKPTYLVDYAVANDDNAAHILRQFNPANSEIGAHLHPWANPPFFDETSDFTSHVINLPVEHVKQKLDALMAVILQKIGVKPESFRTGRWGINGEVLSLLVDAGLHIDSSMYPLYKNEYFSCEKTLPQPYWPDFKRPERAASQRDIYEIPVTAGFNRRATFLAQKLHRLMEMKPFCWLRMNGLIWHSLLLRKLYLSPELCSADDMKRLLNVSLKKRHKVIHMYLHSSSLIQNVTGLTSESNAREEICQRIQDVIEYLQTKADIEFCTLKQAKEKLMADTRP